MKRFTVSLCILAGIILSACAGSPKAINQFMNPSVSREDHCTITVDSSTNLGSVDGNMTSFGTMMGSGGNQIYILPAGTHELMVNYGASSTAGGTIRTTIIEPGTITVDLIAGHNYKLFTDVPSSQSEGRSTVANPYRLVDETDPFVWDSSQERGRAQKRNENARKALASVKMPKANPWSAMQNSEAGPSILEGAWISEEDGNVVELTFEGSIYTMYSKGVFAKRKIDSSQKGSFEYDGTNITFYLQEFRQGNTGAWVNAGIAKTKTTYGCTLNGDTLDLLWKGKSAYPLFKRTSQ